MLINADSFGGGLHEGFFFLGQAVERIHQLVYLPLQRARVRLGIALLRREDAVNHTLKTPSAFSVFEQAFVNGYLFQRVLVIFDHSPFPFPPVQ